MSRLALAAGLLAAALLLPRSAPAAGPGTPQALLARAESLSAALRADVRAQRQRQNYTSVLDAYRRVFEKHPGTRQGDQALMRAGELLTLQFRWTGHEGDLNQAQNYYQRLVQTSPKSPLVDDALLAIAYLYLNRFKDPVQAWLRFRDVTTQAPGGDKAAEAKRQLKRLAQYATKEKPAPAAGAADLACPAPQPAGAPVRAAAKRDSPGAMLSSQPSPTLSMPTVLKRIRSIRHWSNPEYTRVVIDLDQQTNYYSNLLEDRSGGGKPPRLYVDLFTTLVEERFCKPISVNDGILLGIRAGQFTADSVRVVLEIDGLHTYRVFPMQNPFRIVIDVTGGAPGAAAVAMAAAPATPAAVAATAATLATRAAVPALVLPALPTLPESAPALPLSARLIQERAAVLVPPVPVPELIPLPPFTPEGAPPPPGAAAAPPPAAPEPAPARAMTPSPATFSGTAPDPDPPRTAAPAPAAAPVKPTKPGRPAPAVARGAAASPPAGKPSLARQLGLGVRRVVIDAGHGAHDPGAIGIGGLQEKDVTLDLALRVREILDAAGYETVLTRDRDVYLPLEERTAIANTARGDLFLSLHCNSSDSGKLSGVETYFLNLASNLRSMQTAARENSMAVANMSDLQQIVREIQNSKMDESSQFAARVQRSVHAALRRKFPDVKDLGVKQAPFYVLIGAQMPSILAEVSFINNRVEGRRLADPEYRQLIALAITDGVKRYVKTVKTAALAPAGRKTP